MIRVEMVRAWPRRHDTVSVELADGAKVGDALTASNWRLEREFTSLAVFGRPATVQTPLRDGDRIELLRALQMDPKQARRLRAERGR